GGQSAGRGRAAARGKPPVSGLPEQEVTDMPPAAKESGPMARLKAEAGGLVDAFTDRAVNSVRDKVENATGRLTGYVEGDHGPGLMAAVTGARGMAEGKGPVRSMLGATFAGAREKVAGIFRKGKGQGKGGQKLK